VAGVMGLTAGEHIISNRAGRVKGGVNGEEE